MRKLKAPLQGKEKGPLVDKQKGLQEGRQKEALARLCVRKMFVRRNRIIKTKYECFAGPVPVETFHFEFTLKSLYFSMLQLGRIINFIKNCSLFVTANEMLWYYLSF